MSSYVYFYPNSKEKAAIEIFGFTQSELDIKKKAILPLKLLIDYTINVTPHMISPRLEFLPKNCGTVIDMRLLTN